MSIPTFFDAMNDLNAVCMATFGEATNSGSKWTYTPQTGTAFSIDVIFFEAWEQTDQGQGKKTFGAVSSTAPMAFIRVSDWPTDLEMLKGDTLTSPTGVVYAVENQNPDGAGMIRIAQSN